MSPDIKWPGFNWEDPFLLEQQLTEEERLVRETARQYAQDKLAPRVREAFRGGSTPRTNLRRGFARPFAMKKQTPEFFAKWVNSVCWAPPFTAMAARVLTMSVMA